MGIIDYIPVGHDNAITLSELCALTNCRGRDIRREISAARKRGEIILNMQDGEGYFIPNQDDYQFVHHAYNQEHSRALSILASIKALNALRREMERKQQCVTETTSS